MNTRLLPRKARAPGMTSVALSDIGSGPAWGFPEWFIVSQIALPSLLFLPGAQAFRVPIRIAPFAISLAALLW